MVIIMHHFKVALLNCPWVVRNGRDRYKGMGTAQTGVVDNSENPPIVDARLPYAIN